MFDTLRRNKNASVQEKLAAVEAFNALLRERGEVRSKQDTLTRGLEQAEGRLVEIPGEQQAVHDNCYRNTVQREVDSSRPDLTETHNQMLIDLKAERADLAGKCRAYGQELEVIQRRLGKLDGQYGMVEQARRVMWAAIADELVKQVSPDFALQFSRIWTAMDRSRDYSHATDVLALLAPTELTNETRMATIDALSHEYGFTNE